MSTPIASTRNEAEYSLFQLLTPGAIANPYPLYRKIREFEPVHWDPFLHSWVVTSYAESVTALSKFKASRTPEPERLEAMGLDVLKPYAEVMLKQLLFIDPPSHSRIRGMCSMAFTPRRMEVLRGRLTAAAHGLIDKVAESGQMDLAGDFARPFPALVLAALIGLPEEDGPQLQLWVNDVSELLGNFEHDPDLVEGRIESLQQMQAYLVEKLAEQKSHPGEGVMAAMLASEVDGEPKLTDDEIVANVMLMIGGGLEEPANLICAGMLSLLEQPGSLARMGAEPGVLVSGVEELLRYNSPTQQTGRVAPEDVVLGGKEIRKGQALTVVVAAANRDPLRFADPDRLELLRSDNRHLAFGWAAHYCLGAPLARLAGQIAFAVLSERLTEVELGVKKLQWREMASLRGLTLLPVTFHASSTGRAG
jgi:pimeloyl-[acyl-carrier protein] synthase